jgi:hypothetical protein
VDAIGTFWIAVLILLGSIFNYYLNRAPGSDPDDFRIGPMNSGITCDCFLNTLIIGVIVGIMIATSASLFDSTVELIYAGVFSFLIVWIVGIWGRIRRHAEWREFDEVVRRAVPPPTFDEMDEDYIDLAFDDDEEF